MISTIPMCNKYSKSRNSEQYNIQNVKTRPHIKRKRNQKHPTTALDFWPQMSRTICTAPPRMLVPAWTLNPRPAVKSGTGEVRHTLPVSCLRHIRQIFANVDNIDNFSLWCGKLKLEVAPLAKSCASALREARAFWEFLAFFPILHPTINFLKLLLPRVSVSRSTMLNRSRR